MQHLALQMVLDLFCFITSCFNIYGDDIQVSFSIIAHCRPTFCNQHTFNYAVKFHILRVLFNKYAIWLLAFRSRVFIAGINSWL